MDTQQIVALVLTAVFVFWAVGAYNRLVRMRNHIARGFGLVHEQMTHRHELLQQWVDVLRPLLEHVPQPLEAVTAASQQVLTCCELVKARPSAARPVASLRLAEETLAGARTRLQAELPAHVDRMLPSGAVMGTGMGVALINEELAAADSRLGFARHQFNNAAEAYNEAVLQFPTWVIAGLFRFRVAGTL
jgi:LemA protein